jgi:hypothetical protein
MCAVIRRLRYATLSRTFVRAAPDVATCRNACCSSLWPSFQSAVVKKFATRFRRLKTRRRGLIRAVALSLLKSPKHQAPPDCWSVGPRTEATRCGNLDRNPGLNTDASKSGSGRRHWVWVLEIPTCAKVLVQQVRDHRVSFEGAGRGVLELPTSSQAACLLHLKNHRVFAKMSKIPPPIIGHLSGKVGNLRLSSLWHPLAERISG